MELSMQEAQRMLEADKQQRIQQTSAAIRAVLEQYTCDLVAVPQLTSDGRIMATVQIIAR